MSAILRRSFFAPLALCALGALASCTTPAPTEDESADSEEDDDEEPAPKDAGKDAATKDAGKDAGPSGGKKDASTSPSDDDDDDEASTPGDKADAGTAAPDTKKDGGTRDGGAPAQGSLDASAGSGDASTRVDSGASTTVDAGKVPSTPGASLKCDDPKVLFCEDFESLPAGAAKPPAGAKWGAGSGTPMIADKAPMRTGKALQLPQSAGSTIDVNFTPPGNSYFGRMHVYATQLPTSPNYAHWVLVEMGGSGGPEQVRPVGGQYVAAMDNKMGGNFFGPGNDKGPSGDWTNWKHSAPLAPEKWVCVEWEMKDADAAMNLWIDGVDNPELHTTGKMHPPGLGADPNGVLKFPMFNKARIGWTIYGGSASGNLYIDDIAFATARIGCGS